MFFPMIIFIAVLGLIGISFTVTYIVRNYTIKHDILDIPIERSSHVVVTPRGGGLAFVVMLLVGLSVLYNLGKIDMKLYLALAGGGALVAVIGWMDDNAGLTARVRAIFHFLAASWAVFCLGGFPGLNLGFIDVHLSWFGSIVAVIGTAWMINLYNFMDGIDGIAATEAISVAVAVGALLLLNLNIGLACICGLLVCSVAGFLVWNWPPAKIFMGDVGSGFLGFIFACLAIASENTGAIPFIVWILLLGVFVIDATSTLIFRVSQGKKWYEAHRSHVYQLAVQAGYSHKRVSLTVLAINCVLAVIAYWVFKVPHLLLPVSLTTAAILIFTYKYLQKHFIKTIEESIAQSDIHLAQGLLEAAATNEK